MTQRQATVPGGVSYAEIDYDHIPEFDRQYDNLLQLQLDIETGSDSPIYDGYAWTAIMASAFAPIFRNYASELAYWIDRILYD